MIHSEGYLSVTPDLDSRDKHAYRLYYQTWTPETEPTALLLLLHGLGEHSARYQHVADCFVARGYAVYALDHLGHGKSDGVPGYVDKFSHYLNGAKALLEKAEEENPRTPIFLVGHSMGGLISACLLLERQSSFVGCVLSGPAIKAVEEPSRLSLVIIRLLSSLMPRIGVLQLDANGVSRDPQIVAAYLSDPLVFKGKTSARLTFEIFNAMQRLVDNAAAIELPILLMHGEADKMAAAEGSTILHDKIRSSDKTLILYKDLYHEIFNEPERDKVLADMANWLQDRLPARHEVPR